MPEFIEPVLREWLRTWPPHEVDEFFLYELPQPPHDDILHIAKVLFFASLATEEKEPTRVAVAWHSEGVNGLRSEKDYLIPHPDMDHRGKPNHLSWEVLAIEPIPFDVANVAKFAPLAEFGTSVLTVTRINNNFFIDGVARRRPNSNGGNCFVLLAEAPGVISIQARGLELFRFERGEAVSPPPYIFGPGAIYDAAQRMARPSQIDTLTHWTYPPTSILQDLTHAMSRTRHGGLLLFLPTEPLPDVISRIKIRVRDQDQAVLQRAICELGENHIKLLADTFGADTSVRANYESALDNLNRWTDVIGRLTAVDNAVLFGPGFRLLGAQYHVPSKTEHITVFAARDALGNDVVEYEGTHGSRHKAAVSFAYGEEGRIAILSSADGPIRCFLNLNSKVVMWQVRLAAM